MTTLVEMEHVVVMPGTPEAYVVFSVPIPASRLNTFKGRVNPVPGKLTSPHRLVLRFK